MLGEKYYDNKKKSIKAFLGQDQMRKTASQESGMTPQWAAHLVCSSPARTKGKKLQSTWSETSDMTVKNKQPFLPNTVYNTTRNRFSIQSMLCQAQNMISAL